MTFSPTLTSMGMRLVPASSHLPSPTATISPSIGFSLAVSGSTMPLAVFSSCVTALMMTRSSSGFSFIQPSFSVGIWHSYHESAKASRGFMLGHGEKPVKRWLRAQRTSNLFPEDDLKDRETLDSPSGPA